MFLQIENQPGLIADLEGDLFVGHALSNATCKLYHRYAMFLAPLTAGLKHCQFGHCCPVRVKDGGDDIAKQQGDSGGASTESSSGKSYGSKKSGSRASRRCPLKGKARRTTSRAASSIQGIISPLCRRPGDGTSANIPPNEAAAGSGDKRPECCERLTGPRLAGGALVFLRQTRSPASVVAVPVDCVQAACPQC